MLHPANLAQNFVVPSIICVKEVENLTLPSKANDSDLGFDIIATSCPKIVGEQWGDGYTGLWKRIDYVEYGTNLFIGQMHEGVSVDIRPRSSISKYDLILANSIGTVDSGYHGEIKLRFAYKLQPNSLKSFMDGTVATYPDFNKLYKIGDKIGQLVAYKETPVEFQVMDQERFSRCFEQTSSRGAGGFGSTGK